MNQNLFKLENISLELRLEIMGGFLREIGKTSKASDEEKKLFKNLKKSLKISDQDFIQLKNKIRPTLPAVREDRQMNLEEFFITVFDTVSRELSKEQIQDCLSSIHAKMGCQKPSAQKITEICTELSQNLAEIEKSCFDENEIQDEEEDNFTPFSESDEISFDLPPAKSEIDQNGLFADILDEACEEEEFDGFELPPMKKTDTELDKTGYPEKTDSRTTEHKEEIDITMSDIQEEDNTVQSDIQKEGSTIDSESQGENYEVETKKQEENNADNTEEENNTDTDEKKDKSKKSPPATKKRPDFLGLFFGIPVSPVASLMIKFLSPITKTGLKLLKIDNNKNCGNPASPIHRIIAALLDSIILNVAILLPSGVLITILSFFLPVPVTVFLWFIPMFIIFAYYCAFEASEWQGTPGKFLTGLRIVDDNGNKPDRTIILKRVLIRFCPALFAVLAGLSAFIMTILASIFGLLASISSLIIFLGILLIFKDKEKRKTLHDKLANTMVLVYTENKKLSN
jgi:uncharacterized RDD family membrane protein YckC